MKVSHSTRTANLQLVDPVCAAAQEHVEPEFGISFFVSFSAKLRLGRISAVVTGGEIREILFLSFANSFNETTSILEGRVMKVPHSTRTTILQLVDPVCAAAQEHVEPEFGISFFVSFSAKLRLGRISAVVTGGEIREILFLSFANSFNETTSILEGRVMKVPHSTRTTILQLVDPVCAAAQEHVEPEFGISFFVSFSAKLRLGRISAVVTGGGIREIFFLFVWQFF